MDVNTRACMGRAAPFKREEASLLSCSCGSSVSTCGTRTPTPPLSLHRCRGEACRGLKPSVLRGVGAACFCIIHITPPS